MKHTNKQSNETVSKAAEVAAIVNAALVAADVKYIKENMVTKDQFAPVQKLVYGLVSVILLAVVGAAIGLVVLP